MSNFVEFLKNQLPICTSLPIYNHLKDDFRLYAALVKRSNRDFNENLFGRNCAKREYCTDDCLGRPLPKYPEIEPFIRTIRYLGEGEYKGKKVWLVKSILCGSCPMKTECQATCGSVTSFLDKNQGEFEPSLARLQEFTDNTFSEAVEFDLKALIKKGRDDIAWTILNESERKIVTLRALWGLDWIDIANEVDIHEKTCRDKFRNSVRKLKGAHTLQSTHPDQAFVAKFLQCRGDVNRFAKQYKVSVSTVYRKLNEKRTQG